MPKEAEHSRCVGIHHGDGCDRPHWFGLNLCNEYRDECDQKCQDRPGDWQKMSGFEEKWMSSGSGSCQRGRYDAWHDCC
jgi:hypothetical protein